MKTARDLVAALLAFLSAVSLTAAVAGMWVRDNIVSATGFMDVVGPMADDSALQQDFAKSALADIMPGLPLPDWLRGKVEDILTSQVHLFTDSEAYGEIWRASMKDLHGQLAGGGQATLKADLAPVWDALAAPIDSILPFGWEVPVPDSTVINLATFDASWFTQLVTLAESAQLFLVVGVVAAVAAVVLAAHRLFALGALGLAALISGFLSWFALVNYSTFVPTSLTGEKFVGPIVLAFAKRASSDLTSTAITAMAVGALLVAIAIAVSMISGGVRRGATRAVAPTPQTSSTGSVRYDPYEI